MRLISYFFVCVFSILTFSASAWQAAAGKDASNLVRQLASGKTHQQMSATVTLWTLDASYVPSIAKMLQDKDPNIRLAAVTALGELKENAAKPALTRALRDKNKNVRQKASQMLMHLEETYQIASPSQTTEKHIQPEPEQQPELTLQAALAMLKDPHEDLNEEPVEDPRLIAIDALQDMHEPEAYDALIAAAKDPSADVRDAALSALKDSKNPSAIPVFINALQDKDELVRLTAVEALQNIHEPEAYDALIAAVKDPSAHVRATALSELEDSKNPGTIPVIINALQDKEVTVACRAARCLGHLKADPAFDPLLTILNNKKEYADLRADAAIALGDIGNQKAIPYLTSCLKDKDSQIRCGAAVALGRLKATTALPQLISMLKDRKAEIRIYAAHALGKIGNAQACDALAAAAKDKDFTARNSAITALSNMNDKPAYSKLIEIIDSDDQISASFAALALRKYDDPGTAQHIVPLLATYPIWQAQIACILAKLGNKCAVKPLIGALSKGWVHYSEFENSPRDAAAIALMELNDPEGNSYLLSALKHKDIKVIEGAYRFFINQGVSGCEPLLIQVLSDEWMAKDYINCGNPKLASAAKAYLNGTTYLPADYTEKDAPKWNSKLPAKSREGYDYIKSIPGDEL